jgi:DNA-directed RNA polymerase specialized sigma24 family protein
MVAELSADLELALRAATRRAWQPYSHDVEYADALQEMWVWYYSANHGDADPKVIAYAAARMVREYCAWERGQRRGYQPEDQYRYTRTVIEGLVPVALASGGGLPGQDVAEGKRPAGPPAEGGNVPAMVADVLSALRDLDPQERTLVARIAAGENAAVMASEMAVDERTARRRYVRCLDKLAAILNGGG